MTVQLMEPATRYKDAASHVDLAPLSRHASEPSVHYMVRPQPSRDYAALWVILACQNASVDTAIRSADFEIRGIDDVVTSNWKLASHLNTVFEVLASLPVTRPHKSEMPKRISIVEARRLAIEALAQAETRRQDEREREAAFWAALEDEQ